jgi:hypothetical protein
MRSLLILVLALAACGGDDAGNPTADGGPTAETFGPPCNLTRTDAENEWMPSALQLDPQSGVLHLLYEQFVPGSDPLDTEIIHAYLP